MTHGPSHSDQLDERQRHYYRPRGILLQLSYAALFVLNRCLLRILFRLCVSGLDNLPQTGAVIFTPNHSSPLDPPLLAASLPWTLLRNTFWAGKQSTVLKTPLRRCLSRLTRVIPIPEDASAVVAGAVILNDGHHLVWFPEGRRSLTGGLQPFRPGIARLLQECDVPVIPVLIQGAADAYAPPKHGLRLRQAIHVRFGRPVCREQLGLDLQSPDSLSRVPENLRRCVEQLADHPDSTNPGDAPQSVSG